jgi:hypothetical protein
VCPSTRKLDPLELFAAHRSPGRCTLRTLAGSACPTRSFDDLVVDSDQVAHER